jgi:integrase
MATNKLTDAQCKKAPTPDKIKKLSDGNGLYLALLPSGSKSWRLKYRVDGREQTEVFGPYPMIGLAEARDLSAAFRKKLISGPPVKEVRLKAITLDKASETYWAGRKDCGANYLEDATRGLALHLKPLWARDVRSISKEDLMVPLMVLNAEEKFVYVRKIRLWASMVLGWALAQGYCEENAANLINAKTAFGRKKVKHFASVKLRDVPALMARLSLEKELQSVLACKFMAYTWVRTKELRMARWTDFEGNLWRLPDDVMKKGREHLVPLPTQAVELLAKLKLRSRGSEFVFPNDRRLDRPMSENSVLYLLGRIGYGGVMTGHGFRTVASTWANEHGYEPDVIEIALSHSSDAKDAVRSAYNQAQYLPQRRKLLQDFADWLDKPDAGGVEGGEAPVAGDAAHVDVGLGNLALLEPPADGL